jgi:hypothetical protein
MGADRIEKLDRARRRSRGASAAADASLAC